MLSNKEELASAVYHRVEDKTTGETVERMLLFMYTPVMSIL